MAITSRQEQMAIDWDREFTEAIKEWRLIKHSPHSAISKITRIIDSGNWNLLDKISILEYKELYDKNIQEYNDLPF
jgi:hypothetical protein